MATINVGDSAVDYEQIGTGPSLVLLPTLLAEMSVYDLVIEELATERRVTRCYFPGFGASPRPTKDWGTADYADYCAAFLNTLPAARRLWIGHSFGCRPS